MFEFVDTYTQDYGSLGNWIQGASVKPRTDHYQAVQSPYHGKEIGQVPLSNAADVHDAATHAKAAFATWSQTHIKKRVQVMFRLKQLLEEHLDDLSCLIAIENGKTPQEAKAAALKGIEVIEFACSMPNLISGDFQEVSSGVDCMSIHEPLGVVASIAPFNFPLMIPLWTIPIALTAGNTMILKPSEQVPFTAMRLAQYLKAAGLPDGVLNIVNGGRETVEALCDHPDIEALSFVGSSAVGEQVYRRASNQNKRVLALGGAKNHLVLMPDADVEMAAKGIIDSAMGSAGQRCMAASMLVAVGDVSAQLEAMERYTKTLQLGQDFGAIISKQSIQRITEAITEAEHMGAQIRVDGREMTVPDLSQGNWIGPTLIDQASLEMSVTQQEIFGPVLPIVHVKTLEEAIAIENANPYGNAASIFTSSGAAARHFSRAANAGMIGVNIGVPVPREPFAFGGWNQSKFGVGDITGESGLRFWTKDKKVTTKWELPEEQNWMS